VRDEILALLTTGYTPFVLFFVWSLFSLLISITFMIEYMAVQHKPSKPWFAGAFLCQAIALGLGSLLVAPHPLTDFEYLRPWSRFWWAIGLPFFLVAVPVHIYYVAHVVWLRYKARPKLGS
jgi:hypothetical protein